MAHAKHGTSLTSRLAAVASRVVRRRGKRNARSYSRSASVLLERLEDRVVLSVTSSVANGLLAVTSDAADAITITSSNGDVKANYSAENTLAVTPSTNTALNFTGRPRSLPSDPINVLNLDLTLVTQPVLTVTGPRSGVLTSQSHGSVTYTEFERVGGSGRPFDIVVDAASTGSSGFKGDGTADTFSAMLDGDILRIYADGLLVFSADADAVGTVFIRGSSDNDTLVLGDSDLVFPGTISFDGVTGSVDTLEIIGDGAGSSYYLPGAVYGSGTIGYTSGNGIAQLITFVNLTPVIVHDITSYTFVAPSSADVITVDSPAAGQNRISGTSDGVAFESITFYNVTNFTIEAGSNDDAGSPDDSIIIDSSGLVAAGLQNFVINTGIGNDTLSIQSASYSLPVAGGSISFNGGGGSDEIVANANIGFTLFDTGLVSSNGGLISLASVDQASLTGGGSANTFTVSNWTKVANLNGGGGSDTVISANNASFTLSDASLAQSTGGSFTLASIEIAEFSGGTAANTFTVSGWTGAGTLDGLGGSDTIIATRDANFTLADDQLTVSTGGSWTLAGIESGFLTGDVGANTFVVSDWTGTLVLDGLGGTDTVTSSNDADFALSNGSLDRSTGTSFTLTSIESANLTGGTNANVVTVSGWTGTGTLDGGDGSDTVVSSNNANFTLSDSSLVVSGGANLTITGIETANLTGGSSANGFTVSGWTGTGTINGGTGSDTLTSSRDADYTLSNIALVVSGGANLALTGLEVANLTGGGSDNTFTVSGWSGTGTLDGSTGSDLVAATNDTDFALSDVALARTGLGTLNLAGIERANLTGGTTPNSFAVSSWTGTGTLDGAAGSDILIATNNVDFTLTNSSFARSGLGTLNLSSVEVANLIAGAGDNSFTVSGWTGTGTLDAALGNDSLFATNNTDFTLTDGSLAQSASGTLILSGFETANLTGGLGDNTFSVSGWTGTGTLDADSGSDTLVAANDADFTISDATIARTGFGLMGLVGFEVANIAGGVGANTFTVTGWTGTGSMDGGNGTDTLVASNDADFVLTDDSLARSGLGDLSLIDIEIANLTGGSSANIFTVSGWTGTGTLDGSSGTDTVAATNDVNFTLADASLARTGAGTMNLVAIEHADLTGSPSGNSFDVTNWTGTGTLNGDTGNDTVIAVNDSNFTLANSSLARTGLGTLSLSSIEVAQITGGIGDNTFTVTDWTGAGTVNASSGDDTLFAANDTDFTLTDSSLARGGVGSLSLLGFEIANLTGGAGDNRFTVSGWTGTGTIDAGTGNDRLAAGNDVDFTLSDTALARTGLGTINLSGVETAELTGGNGANIFTVSDWTGTGTMNGAAGNDTIVASNDVSFELADDSLARSGVGIVALADIEIANLTGASSANGFIVTGWTGTGTLNGDGGTDSIFAENDTNFTVTDGSLIRTGAGTLSLIDIEHAALTGGGSGNNFTVSGWTGTGTLDGSGGSDTVIAANDVDFTLSDNTLTRSGLGNLDLTSIEIADLSDGNGDHAFVVSGWTGAGTLDGGNGSDVLRAIDNANFTVTDTAFVGSGSATMILFGIEALDLTGGLGNNNFDLSGWSGTATLDGSTGNDSFAASRDTNFVLSTGSLLGSGLGPIGLTGIEAVTLTGGSGANSFTVNNWTGSVTLNGAAGNDTFSLGAQQTLDSLVGTFAVFGGTDSLGDVLTIDDSATGASAAYTITATGVSRSGGPTITYSGVEQLMFHGGSGGNDVLITGTPATTTVNVFTGAGDDDVSIDSNGALAGGLVDEVLGSLMIDGESGTNSLLIEDGSDTTGDNVQVTPTSVGFTGELFSGGSLAYSGIASMTLNLGSGTTGDSVHLRPSSTTSFVVNGNGPSTGPGDSLNLNFTGISGRQLATTGPGAGTWTFDNAQPVSYTGSEQVNRAEIIVTSPDAGAEPRVHVLDAGTRRERYSFLAYDASYRGGVRVAVGDVNGDGTADIITAPGKGNRSEVRVFDGRTGLQLTGETGSFFPYGPTSKSGVFVAAGDVDGDGFADIVTGLERGGEIRIFSGRDASPMGNIVAFTARFRAGVRVAVADVTGDGNADIIAAPGGGGKGEVRVFDGVTKQQLPGSQGSFLAVGSAVLVAAGDVNGDGFADIVTSTGGRKEVRIFNGRDGTQLGSFMPNLVGFKGEVRLALTDVNGDGKADIITGAGPGSRPQISLFDGRTLALLDTVLADFPITGLGIFVAAGGLKNG